MLDFYSTHMHTHTIAWYSGMNLGFHKFKIRILALTPSFPVCEGSLFHPFPNLGLICETRILRNAEIHKALWTQSFPCFSYLLISWWDSSGRLDFISHHSHGGGRRSRHQTGRRSTFQKEPVCRGLDYIVGLGVNIPGAYIKEPVNGTAGVRRHQTIY